MPTRPGIERVETRWAHRLKVYVPKWRCISTVLQELKPSISVLVQEGVVIPEKSDVTEILREWSEGDPEAPARLMPLVYEELRRRAGDCLRRERRDHTLQPTALVHEAYVKLVGQNRAQWKNRAHFCSVAAQLMRRILVKYAEARNAGKRGGQMRKIYLDETCELAQERLPDLLALDDALKSLAVSHPRESEIVELKFFGGLNSKEIGEILNVSTKTVLRDWQFAKAWLNRQLAREELYG